MKFVTETGREKPFFIDDLGFSSPEQPIIGVTWHDANAFCRWQGKRLPTEAEWEKAASWDEKKNEKLKYPWGNNAPIVGKMYLANYQPTSPARSDSDGYLFTSPVGSYEEGKSPYGVYDMAGNATEWLADWYADKYYKISPLSNPKGPDSGKHKALRGGSWGSVEYSIRNSFRAHEAPGEMGDLNGFRCAK
jgi:iron(II)-dependent oxidoreductase